MEDYKPNHGIYIGGLVTMVDGTVGNIEDLWYKGDVYMAQVNGRFVPVNELRVGSHNDTGTGL